MARRFPAPWQVRETPGGWMVASTGPSLGPVRPAPIPVDEPFDFPTVDPDGADPGAVGWFSFRHSTARPTVPVQDGKHGLIYLFDAPVAEDPPMHVHNFLI